MSQDDSHDASASKHKLKTYHYTSSTQTYDLAATEHDLPARSILIRTTHSGICFTDVHAKPKSCGLGHEGIGTVAAVGSSVTHFSVGDRVGWGWLHTSCGHCSACVDGYRQYCAEARGFAFSDLDQGAFGDGRIIDAEFAYRIPETIASEHAAPLMCAGASVYEALDAAGTKPHHRIGVVGVGGLGHMAVLFGRAMGCGVTAISSDNGKRDDAFALGVDDFLDLKALSEQPPQGGKKIDVLLITSNVVPDLGTLLPYLNRRATIVLMTIQTDALQVPYMDFVLPGHRLIASTEASRENHLRMLEFAARIKIKPWIETFPMDADGLKAAFTKLENGGMRYRGVLIKDMATDETTRN